MEKDKKVELYAYLYDKENNSYGIDPKPIQTFKNMKEFEETSGIYAMCYFMEHPAKDLGFCYCFKGQDILNKEHMQLASYGFMEAK